MSLLQAWPPGGVRLPFVMTPMFTKVSDPYSQARAESTSQIWGIGNLTVPFPRLLTKSPGPHVLSEPCH